MIKKISVALITACCLCASAHNESAPIRPLKTLQYQHFENFASWFDGVTFEPKKFVSYYRQRQFSYGQIWELYQTIDKTGGVIVLSDQSLSDHTVNESMKWRQQLTRELVQLRSPVTWMEWKRKWPSRIEEKTKHMSQQQRDIFLMYVGLSPESFMNVQAPMRYQSYDDLNKKAFFPHFLSSATNNQKVIQVGPYTPSHAYYSKDNWLTEQKDDLTPIDTKQIYLLFQKDIEKSSLLGIKIPLGAIQSADDFEKFRRDVQKFSNVLGMRTKMGPKALGINSRVFWNYSTSDRKGAQAHTIKIADNTYLIQSTWTSISHEWFHALSKSVGEDMNMDSLSWSVNETYYSLTAQNRYTVRSFWNLRDAIETSAPSRKKWPVIMNQAQERTQRFLGQQWQYNPFENPKNNQWSSEKQTVQASLSQFTPYDAAVVATHMYWLNNAQKIKHQSTWVARRKLMDRMLKETGWSNAPGTNIKPGYFSEPEEWLAGSFQADMRAFDSIKDTDTSLMNTPLEQEAQDYAVHWDNFFMRIQPWWGSQKQEHHTVERGT